MVIVFNDVDHKHLQSASNPTALHNCSMYCDVYPPQETIYFAKLCEAAGSSENAGTETWLVLRRLDANKRFFERVGLLNQTWGLGKRHGLQKSKGRYVRAHSRETIYIT